MRIISGRTEHTRRALIIKRDGIRIEYQRPTRFGGWYSTALAFWPWPWRKIT